MMQLADFIVGYIHQNIRVSSEKSIIRVDGFEDLRLYLRICERMDELCANQGNTLIAKLSRSKFAQMEGTGQWPSEAAVMRQRGWVDEEDHMTSYRNQLPEAGKKTCGASSRHRHGG